MSVDVAIVGGGIIGCAVARTLARSGMAVTVLERDRPGRQASWAAAGMLAPQAEADRAGPFFDLLLRARDRFPALSEELLQETGIDIGYLADGMLLVALSEIDEAGLEARWAWQREAGLPVERLDGLEARRLVPGLSPEVRSALLFPGDHQVENRSLVEALRISAERAGARFATGVEVRELASRSGGVRVEMASGEAIDAGHAVLAAGAWSGAVRGLPRALPVEPVHGELIAYRRAGPAFGHTVASPRGYLVPRADGRLIVGATSDRLGFDVATTEQGRARLVAAAREAVPELAGEAIVDHWFGFRPGTPDDLPILGPDPDLPSLVYACGHYRNGILLAPITAEIVGDLLSRGGTSLDLQPFRPDRF